MMIIGVSHQTKHPEIAMNFELLIQGKVNKGFFIEAGADDFVGGSNRFANDAQWIMMVVMLIVLEIFDPQLNVPNFDP